MVLLFVGIYHSVVIIEEDTDVKGGVGVRETGTRDEGVDMWVVRGVFRAEVRGVSLSKPGKSGGINFLRSIPQCTC